MRLIGKFTLLLLWQLVHFPDDSSPSDVFVIATKLLISLLTGLITHWSARLKCFKTSNQILHRNPVYCHIGFSTLMAGVHLNEEKVQTVNIYFILHKSWFFFLWRSKKKICISSRKVPVSLISNRWLHIQAYGKESECFHFRAELEPNIKSMVPTSHAVKIDRKCIE